MIRKRFRWCRGVGPILIVDRDFLSQMSLGIDKPYEPPPRFVHESEVEDTTGLARLGRLCVLIPVDCEGRPLKPIKVCNDMLFVMSDNLYV